MLTTKTGANFICKYDLRALYLRAFAAWGARESQSSLFQRACFSEGGGKEVVGNKAICINPQFW
jgi:hypothetical protein